MVGILMSASEVPVKNQGLHHTQVIIFNGYMRSLVLDRQGQAKSNRGPLCFRRGFSVNLYQGFGAGMMIRSIENCRDAIALSAAIGAICLHAMESGWTIGQKGG